MNNFGLAAIRAVELYRSRHMKSPRQGWKEVTAEIFGRSPSSRNKACPRDAFLGLCEEDLVNGIPRGEYTKSEKNKQYALDAIILLKENPELAGGPLALWKRVMKGTRKAHNQQMNVVIALWEAKLLAEQS